MDLDDAVDVSQRAIIGITLAVIATLAFFRFAVPILN